jgi:DNA-binding CsgD family transcriptional regulator
MIGDEFFRFNVGLERLAAMAGTTERLRGDTLVGSIYDAAFDPRRWPEAMGGVARTIGGDSSFLFSTHSDVEPHAVVHMYNHAPEMPQVFARDWSAQDPWALGAQRKNLMCRGTLVVGSELVGRAELHRTAFYNEFSRFHGIDSMVGAVLFDGTEDEPMPFTNLVWHRGAGKPDFELKDRDRLRRFIPHFQRALNIQRRLGWLADRRAHDAFSALHIASIVLDRSGYVHHHNDVGGRLLSTLPPQCVRSGRLRTLGTRCSLSLGEALQIAGRGEPARLTALLANEPARLIGATLIRISAGTESFGVSREGSERYLLLVEIPRTNGKEVAEAVARLFALSPAEVRVLAGLLDGRTAAQVAAASGTSLPTVRTQISSLLSKTGTATQNELMLLLRSLRI